MRKRFPCGHRGLGQYCHRCAENRMRSFASGRKRIDRQALAAVLGVRPADFPEGVLARAAGICEQVAGEGLPALRRFRAKKIVSLDDVFSIPIGRHHRLLFRVHGGLPRYRELLTHEQYDPRSAASGWLRWAIGAPSRLHSGRAA